jgi:hypothetical protein
MRSILSIIWLAIAHEQAPLSYHAELAGGEIERHRRHAPNVAF